ncbi:hypothetical protein FB45DRAFT_889603 [Roridomyces roridus]|uniref:F-box domain-containing protein n=1 Tax=Roridomyces roridus TaxID=1738132 RepID=A0AAD7G356_9AGAR|nr:hypothetical protein FB45DRAFT_889603 [Roridomyces roridus]
MPPTTLVAAQGTQLLMLPNEVLAAIIEGAALADQATLCRVSRLFHQLSLPILNRAVILHVDRTTTEYSAFCSAMIQNYGRADAIRFLALRDSRLGSERKPDYDLVTKSMGLMHRLEHLSIVDHSKLPGSDPGLIPCLESLSFPALRICHIDLDLNFVHRRGPAVARFLARHPNLTHVRLWQQQITDSSTWASASTLLPNLRHFQGSACFVPALATRRLTEARIDWWGFPDIDGVLEALRSASVEIETGLPFVLSNFHFHAGVDELRALLQALSVHMSHTTTLQLRILLPREAMKMLAEYLPRFTRLEYVALNQPQHLSFSLGPSEWLNLQSWGDACPTLRACSVGSQAWRRMDDGKWEEYDKGDFEMEAGLSVFELI